jgi:hypothetical protein
LESLKVWSPLSADIPAPVKNSNFGFDIRLYELFD